VISKQLLVDNPEFLYALNNLDQINNHIKYMQLQQIDYLETSKMKKKIGENLMLKHLGKCKSSWNRFWNKETHICSMINQ
jgi:hypothetical protein